MKSSLNKQRKNMFRASVSFFHRIGRDAYLDWALVVTATFLLTVIAVFVAYFAYSGTSVLNVPVKSAQTGAQKMIFDEKLLDKVLNYYEIRAEETKRLEGGYSGPGDPSI